MKILIVELNSGFEQDMVIVYGWPWIVVLEGAFLELPRDMNSEMFRILKWKVVQSVFIIKRRPFTKYPMDWIGEVSIARGPTCEGQDSDYDEAHFELL